MKVAADLHIHSGLSPCGHDDMTPHNICGMASVKELQMIAVTDHNSVGNLRRLEAAAQDYGIILLPGIEIQTREEIHVLGYFPTVEAAEAFAKDLALALPKRKNVVKLFGHQWLYNEEDEAQGEVADLLLQSIEWDLKETIQRVKAFGGVAVPAHVDKAANSLVATLGFVPPDLPVATLEISGRYDRENDPMMLASFQLIRSSDAHFLRDLLEAEEIYELPTCSREAMLAYLRGGE
ncbi:PHP domain-containing protein [Gottschalkiaceae bacterium SANA]|nr:PHP domain-containing protein [Gottschalkiaceae bacterium SANA]